VAPIIWGRLPIGTAIVLRCVGVSRVGLSVGVSSVSVGARGAGSAVVSEADSSEEVGVPV